MKRKRRKRKLFFKKNERTREINPPLAPISPPLNENIFSPEATTHEENFSSPASTRKTPRENNNSHAPPPPTARNPSSLDKLDLNNKGSKLLHAIDKFTPDDRNDIILQAERKHGLRAPAAVLNTAKSISDLQNRGQRLLFERSDGENKDGLLRKGLDAAYLTSQAGTQLPKPRSVFAKNGSRRTNYSS
ncbi:MAG: hypothetical protein FWD19_05430 [Defluviitaleaceae bacterium]|nr:hypothetical protein [Defluviitaleaceae bacterium]